ncbi:MAG: hypothetical protein HYT87_16185 [Nitrospirae bacterium]|nr:hypothetical protein [Nitrospirota bacterium]
MPRVVYLGPDGSFSSIAARRLFRDGAAYRPVSRIRIAFRKYYDGDADFVVAPIESSQGGTIHETISELCRGSIGSSESRIVCEVDLHVRLALLARGTAKSIRIVYSHPQGIYRAQEWLDRHARDVKVVEVSSTALAAKKAAQNVRSAALASRDTAAMFRLKVLNPSIGRPAPTTFVLVGRSPLRGGSDKSRKFRTSMVFTLKHRPQSLARALMIPGKRHLNLTRVLSIPIPEAPGEYMFLAEMQGRQGDPAVDASLRDLTRASTTLKVLGSYPFVQLA